jgi:hypothetical protein
VAIESKLTRLLEPVPVTVSVDVTTYRPVG